MKWFINLVINCIIILLIPCIYLLGYLPYHWQQRIAGILTVPLRKTERYKVIQKNLSICFPEKTSREINAIANKNMQHTMGMIFSLFSVWHGLKHSTKVPYKITGLEYVRECNEQGQGCLILGSHFVCMELASQITAVNGVQLGAVFADSNYTLLSLIMKKTRQKINTPLIVKNSPREMFKLLRNGGNLWYAPDQSHGGNMKTLVDFFGVQVNTLASVKRFLTSGKAKLICCEYYQDKAGVIHVDYLPAFPDIENMDSVQIAQAYITSIEKLAIRYPEQYYWVHRRFKNAIDY